MGKKICLEIGMKNNRENKKKNDEITKLDRNNTEEERSPVIARLLCLIFFLIFLFLFVKYKGGTWEKNTRFMKKGEVQQRGESVSFPVSFISNDRSDIRQDVPKKLQVLRIATWNLFPLDFGKMIDPFCGNAIASIISEFDLVALQGIHARNSSVLDTLIFLLKEKGKNYDYIWSDRKTDKECSNAFVFNTDQICPDRDFSCVLEIPGGSPPLSALISSFRPIIVPAQKAFTFILVNIDLERIKDPQKTEALYDLYDAARKRSGHGGFPEEDDIILLGTFFASPDRFSSLQKIPDLVAVHLDKATRQDGLSVDHILFENKALSEYIERFGIMDPSVFLKISPDEAKRISFHRPLWADFSLYEGGAGNDFPLDTEFP